MSSKFSRKHWLILLGLLAVTGGAMMLRSGHIHPLTATGSIASGQTVSGTITTGTQVDEYTFTPVVGNPPDHRRHRRNSQLRHHGDP
jgi:hypothetical protein